MPLDPQAKAKFTPVGGAALVVHFNPTSLQVTLANTLDTKQGKGPKQFVKDSSATLSVEVIFDTTDDGSNVLVVTAKLAAMMAPATSTKSPPTVSFEWGSYRFTGMIASYKEVIDFFSSNGVPLRSTVTLTMSKQDNVFTREQGAGSPGGGAVDVPNRSGQSTTDVAGQGGDPSAGQSIAAANGEESMRFPQSPTITVDPSIPLSAPVAFASVGAGVGLGAGAAFAAGGGVSFTSAGGISGAASISAGASAGGAFATFGAAASFSSPMAGGEASAGVPAAAGAFALLRVPPGAGQATALQASRYPSQTTTYAYATADGATFDVGGRAILQGSTGINANASIQFEEG